MTWVWAVAGWFLVSFALGPVIGRWLKHMAPRRSRPAATHLPRPEYAPLAARVAS
ncbi:MAG TPA: hypothetical protein VE646_09885 [Actinomycetota bacterium]|nr:hypothetical protein [Actinomycetota bacterium]